MSNFMRKNVQHAHFSQCRAYSLPPGARKPHVTIMYVDNLMPYPHLYVYVNKKAPEIYILYFTLLYFTLHQKTEFKLLSSGTNPGSTPGIRVCEFC
jgi:hypothetical protein